MRNASASRFANRLFTTISYARSMVARMFPIHSDVVTLVLRFFCVSLGLAFSQPLLAQAVSTYVVTNDGAINSSRICTSPLIRTFNVTDSFTVADVDLGVLITHTWRGDLQITLVSPNGTRVQLVNGDTQFTSGDNFNVRLDDSASQLVNTDNPTGNHLTTAPPFQNRFRPNNALSAFNGQSAQGVWQLEMCDLFPSADNGNFRHAELYLTAQPTNFADLSLTKQLVGAPPVSGGTATWRLTVINATASNTTASGILVQDTLPAGFTFASANGTGTFDPATGIWTVGNLAPGQSAAINLTGSVSAPAGSVISNVAEIISSSAADLDSTPANGITSEDDYAISTFTVQSGRPPGIVPNLICPAGTAIFDWDTIPGWAAGSTDNTYAFATFGGMRFQLTNDGAFLNNATFGGQSPTVVPTLTGGLIQPQNSLTMLSDQADRNGEVELVITLPRVLTGVQFSIFDVDFFSGQFADRVEVIGINGGTTVMPVLTNGNVNMVTGNVVVGDGLSADTEPFGNVVVTFTAPVEQIVIRYGNDSTAPTDPGQQAIAIHDIIACNPFASLSVTKVSTLISDPVNGTNSPKAIPGALIEYIITISNAGTSATDTNSVVIWDQGPADARLCRVSQPGGPVNWADPGGSSGLTYAFTGIGSGSDDLEFSNDGGASWNYTPNADADGCDGAITDFRLQPGGALEAGRSVELRARYIID
ncbi:proprotein convertase P-domain-containing protein [Porphyrobacter sp. HT-58-2]|uniref:proprotein convertase P-domain-containing protein n=1 Tax=Porphyrobacter sp. HT-58-2 TaxID=2023229 RepID=UPI001F213509|nr:proprotein convertase P-domain-containing protein [Porphyrobacter sp. HT-58-2]